MSQIFSEDEILNPLTAINKILEATYNDQEAAEKAIKALDVAREQFERRLNIQLNTVTQAVENSASDTATKAAALLRGNFIEADKAAIVARSRYEDAAQSLGWKMFSMALVAAVTFIGSVFLLIWYMTPSLDDIHARRQEVMQLEQAALALEKRGAKLIWNNCGKRICFKTVEEKGENWRAQDDTYRIPAKS